MPDGPSPPPEPEQGRDSIGCTVGLVVVNAVLIGPPALAFATGRYASVGQELYYRYLSIGILAAAVVVPAVLLMLGRCRSPLALRLLTAWLLAAPFLWYSYRASAGGGV
jgi:hypothetical protein